MRSIHTKIVAWALATFAISLAAFGAISLAVMSRPSGPPDFFRITIDHLRDEAVLAYEEGGRERLASHLAKLNTHYPADHRLTDAAGIDLADGVDRRADVASASRFPTPPRFSGGKIMFVNHSDDGRYHFLVTARARFDPWGILPYFGAIVLVIALLAYALSAHLVRPVRHLRRAVDRFGQGDLDARASSTRKDEIGDLARAFDQMAERIETLLSAERRLLQDVSHELRSPLARLGFAVNLARSEEDRDAALDQITKETGRLATLVDELLQLNRSEDDAFDREPVHFELGEFVQILADDTRYEADAKGCTLTVRAEENVAIVGEWELLRRAVENIIRNAVRYTPTGTAVEIDIRRVLTTAVVTVRDYGPGVPEDLLTSIFDPFCRVGDDRSRTSGGVGLGLSIARRAVVLHRGRIEARNMRPGLLVTVELPTPN